METEARMVVPPKSSARGPGEVKWQKKWIRQGTLFDGSELRMRKWVKTEGPGKERETGRERERERERGVYG